MRTITLAVAGAVVAATVTGCGAAADTTTHGQEPKRKPAFTVAEQHYLDFINGNSVSFGFTNRRVDRRLVSTGKQLCESLDAGITFDDIADASIQTDVKPGDAAAFIIGATDYLCPEWAGERKAWSSEFGGLSS